MLTEGKGSQQSSLHNSDTGCSQLSPNIHSDTKIQKFKIQQCFGTHWKKSNFKYSTQPCFCLFIKYKKNVKEKYMCFITLQNMLNISIIIF